jgi:hypothetical protein
MKKEKGPTTFKVKEKDIVSLIVQLVIFLVICAVLSFLIGILTGIPIIGIIFALLGSLMELYSIVGIILCVLNFLGILK